MEALGIDLALLIWQAVAFGLLVFLLYRFAYKPVMNMLDQRTERITESIAQAEQIKQELAAAQKRGEEEMQRARRDAQELLGNAQAASQPPSLPRRKKPSASARRCWKRPAARSPTKPKRPRATCAAKLDA